MKKPPRGSTASHHQAELAVRVLVAEHHAVVRAGLRLLIDSHPAMSVVGEAGTYDEALAVVNARRVDVVTVGFGIPGGPTCGLIREIRQTTSKPHVVVLTMHDEPSYARCALAAGAACYVVKTATDHQLFEAIRHAAAGCQYCTLTHASAPVGPASAETGRSQLEALSEREREVLGLIARGFTNQQAADKLFLSVKTVESYRSRLMSKLGLKNRAEVTQFARDMGLLGETRF